MRQAPRIRTVLSCTLLVVSLGAAATACGTSGSNPLAASPFNAGDSISVNGPSGDGKANPDKPLEITSKGDGGRITDVTATDGTGRQLAGELSADGTRWHNTVPLAAGVHYTVRVATEDDDGAPGNRTMTFDTASASHRLNVTFGPKGASTASASRSPPNSAPRSRARPPAPRSSAP